MKRREFFEKAGIGSAVLASLPVVGSAAAPKNDGKQESSQGKNDWEHEHKHEHEENYGALSSATISFGQWDLETPLDRFPNVSDRFRNYHQLIPSEVEIKKGGVVNFIISGFHHILIYGNGKKPKDVVITNLITPSQAPVPPLINDDIDRVYRGLDPSVFPVLPPETVPPTVMQDRVEVVRFPNAGRYLVICGVLPHFFDEATHQFIMFGYVKVRR